MAIGFKGTSIADIEQGAEDALEEDIANLSPASNSVAANLDGGVAAVDWSSKTPKVANVNNEELSVSGSGYLISIGLVESGTANITLTIDGTQLSGSTSDGYFANETFLFRFNSGFSVENADFLAARVNYVLD